MQNSIHMTPVSAVTTRGQWLASVGDPPVETRVPFQYIWVSPRQRSQSSHCSHANATKNSAPKRKIRKSIISTMDVTEPIKGVEEATSQDDARACELQLQMKQPTLGGSNNSHEQLSSSSDSLIKIVSPDINDVPELVNVKTEPETSDSENSSSVSYQSFKIRTKKRSHSESSYSIGSEDSEDSSDDSDTSFASTSTIATKWSGDKPAVRMEAAIVPMKAPDFFHQKAIAKKQRKKKAKKLSTSKPKVHEMSASGSARANNDKKTDILLFTYFLNLV